MLPRLNIRATRLLARARRSFRAFGRDAAGGVAVVVAILSPVMIGSMGLGAEAGYWYLEDRKVQGAADVAAHGIGKRRAAGDEQAALQSLAEYIVGRSDVDMSATAVQINIPPTQGAFTNDANAIEILVERTVPRMFSKMYTTGDVTVTGRAVVRAMQSGVGCILALSQESKETIKMSGSTTIALDGCDVVNNAPGESTKLSGSATIDASCFQSAGTVKTSGSADVTLECPQMRVNQPSVPDPMAHLAEPALTGACQSDSVGKNNKTTSVTPVEAHSSGMTSMRFCNGVNFRGTVNLAPGLYLVEGGDFKINSNTEVIGDGVIFFLAPGVAVKASGNADMTVSAPSGGAYAGVAMFGSRSAGNIKHSFTGSSTMQVDGAIYTPTAELKFSGGVETGHAGCTQLIGYEIEFTGNSGFSLNCQEADGPAITIGGEYALVE